MQGLLLYFSGTGNTKFVGHAIMKSMLPLGYSMQTCEAPKEKIPNLEYDVIIIGFPKYFGYIPLFFLDYIKENLGVALNEKKAILYCTEGAAMGTTFHDLSDILLQKNYSVVATKSFLMPNNYLIKENPSVTSKDEIQKREENCRMQVEEFVQGFLLNKELIEDVGLERRDQARRIAHQVTRQIPQRVKHFSVSKECTKCGLCVEKCPVENIKLDSEIEFSTECVLCVRCFNICPHQAICYENRTVPQYRQYIKSI